MPRRAMTYSFSTVLSEIDAVFIKTAIILPAQVVRKLPKGRIRMEGMLNDAPFALAVQNLKDGSRYFSVGAPLRKAARIKIGDAVKVSCRIVDPEKLDVPEELEAVLAQDDLGREAWEKLTTGYKRSLIHYITSVKNVDSRINRSMELLDKAKAKMLHVQKKAK
jgi:hypothetical protein